MWTKAIQFGLGMLLGGGKDEDDTAGKVGGRVRNFLGQRGNYPTLSHMVEVAVVGGPDSDIRRIWYLCLAAAFGRLRLAPSFAWPPVIQSDWDITNKSVSIRIIHVKSGIGETALNSLEGDGSGYLDSLQRGPIQLTIGGTWSKYMFPRKALRTPRTITVVGGQVYTAQEFVDEGQTVPEAYPPLIQGDDSLFTQLPRFASPQRYPRSFRVPNVVVNNVGNNRTFPDVFRELTYRVGSREVNPYRVINAADQRVTTSFLVRSGIFLGNRRTFDPVIYAPVLPDNGRVITTAERFDPVVQPPKPFADGTSRVDALSLVAAALADPGFLVASPKTAGLDESPLVTGGVYAYPPDSAVYAGTAYEEGGIGEIANRIAQRGQASRNLPPLESQIPGSSVPVAVPTRTEQLGRNNRRVT